MKKYMASWCMIMIAVATVWGQGSDVERIERDIEVAENVLSTLIKQKFDKNEFIPVQVEGEYRSGYGVTFYVPNSFVNWISIPRPAIAPRAPRVRVYNGSGNGYTYSIQTDEEGDILTEEIEGQEEEALRERLNEKTKKLEEEAAREAELAQEEAEREAERAREEAEEDEHRSRSIRGAVSIGRANWGDDMDEKDVKEHNKLLIEAAKTFMADYSSILSQLKPEERIVVTNRNQGRGDHYFQFWSDDKRFFLSIEGTGVDIKQYQSGKLTRDQFVAKLKVVESEVDSERSQDLELITTIFARLYEPDLSKTYFTESNVYYERLKDYGAIFYMQVFSSNEMNRGYYNMPTQKMERVTEVERNKKVTELYPVFEKELKENILEYGRTVKSLKPEESLVFNVKITKCKQCGIPSSIEVITKASVLSDYLSGKLDKNAALAKMEVRKGPLQ
jgi:hypothetical protein